MNKFGTLIVLSAAAGAFGGARGNVATWVNIRAQSPPPKTAPATPRSAPKTSPKTAPKSRPGRTRA